MPNGESNERGRRKQRRGVVISRGGDKTIVVQVAGRKRHPKYEKVIRIYRKLYAHDEKNECQVGDVVRVEETRPLSRMKRWRLLAIEGHERIKEKTDADAVADGSVAVIEAGETR